MNEQTAVQLHPTTRRALLQMMRQRGDGRNITQVVDTALKAWLAAQAVADPAAATAAAHGYQWKSLFLPEGTLLRMELHGTYHVAAVVGDHIVYQQRRYSPRQFVMHLTGQVRNAWLSLWIHCPGDARWHLADTRRVLLRRARPDTERSTPPPPTPTAPTTSAAPTGPAAWAPPVVSAASVAPSVPATAAALSAPSLALRAHRRQSYLKRTDCVLDDQPDLSIRLPAGRGAGRVGAGRAGPRDRRAPARFHASHQVAPSAAIPATP